MAHKNSHFPPPPKGSFPDEDRLLQWLSQQTISAQKLITGTLQADQTVSSSNFSSGSAGWQIDGNGDAEFNAVTVRGDIESSNWDGTSPADLSSRDGGATAGFYLDSSEGAAQFEGSIWIGGTLVVDGATSLGAKLTVKSVGGGVESSNFSTGSSGWRIAGDGSAEFQGSITIGGTLTVDGATTLNSTLTMGTGAIIRTASSGERVELTSSSTGLIDVFDSSEQVGQIGVDEGVFGTGDLIIDNVAGFGNDTGISFANGGTIEARLHYPVGTIEQLSIPDGGESDTDLWVPGLGFLDDTDSGFARLGSNSVGIVAGADVKMSFGTQVRSDVIKDDTTSSSANMVIDSGTGQMQRSTSSLKYKPDWQWAKDAVDMVLPTPIRWTDERGQVRLGFGAEHVHEAVPEAYEEETYDLRSLVAILSEKVKRLEGQVSPLGHLAR